MNKKQLGLSLGSLFGLMHLLWVLAVAAGMGQALADIWHRSHFLTDMHVVAEFAIGNALFGVIGAFVSGYITGWIFGHLMNRFTK